DFRILRVLVHGMAAAHHLDADAAGFAKLADHGVALRRPQPVASRMGEHRLAARLHDPFHGLAHGRPALGHETGPAFDQVAREDVADIAADALLDQETGEVGT